MYYDQGGNSKWLVAALQTAGFPFLIPFLLLSPPSSINGCREIITSDTHPPPSLLLLSAVYTVLGVILAAGGILYSVAIDYLPASTHTLVNSTQLAFTAIFSLFINAQVFTPCIINSVVLLTFAPTLLVFGKDDDKSGSNSQHNYILGLLFTLGASACPALLFSLTQLAFEKIIRRENLRELLNMTVLQSVVATFVTLAGLFASGEWKSLKRDMDDYKQGTLSYFLNVVGTAVACQAYNFGTIALTFKVSSLFSNVVIRLGTPIVPFLSVVFLHEEMSGMKVMALWLALWGFASYIYQHYVDDLKAYNAERRTDETSIMTL